MAERKAWLSSDLSRRSGGTEGGYDFFGSHLLANYVGCRAAALADDAGLAQAFEEAARAAGAAVLGKAQHCFSPHGMTAVLLLAESHASIHTYPEHAACFVDFFTCGRACQADRFEAALCDYLQPASVQRRLVFRHDGGFEESSLAGLGESRRAA